MVLYVGMMHADTLSVILCLCVMLDSRVSHQSTLSGSKHHVMQCNSNFDRVRCCMWGMMHVNASFVILDS